MDLRTVLLRVFGWGLLEPLPHLRDDRCGRAFWRFFLVVLKDAVLLPFLDALPVCLERYVEEGISTKH